MYRSKLILEQKGMMKVASEYDALSVSNRVKKDAFEGVGKENSEQLQNAIGKLASSIHVDDSLEKEAGFSNGLELFSGVRKMIATKLGVSEGVAQDMTSNVITKSDKIVKEYGGDQVMIASNIIDEMKGQIIENPDILKGKVDLHPMSTGSGKIQEQVKARLVQELGMSQRDAELYKTLIVRQAQDLTTTMRPKKRDEIAMGIVDIVASSKDLTSIYGFKDSPMLVSSLRIQLGV